MFMDSVRDLSKEKDIIRIIGRMPDRVLDKEAAAEGTDILDRIYEVHIGTQDNLIEMLQKAGYIVTKMILILQSLLVKESPRIRSKLYRKGVR